MAKELIIDRAVWLRGEGNEESFLLRAKDQKMCCVGIYLKGLGVEDERLLDTGMAEDTKVLDTKDIGLVVKDLPDEAKWLEDSTTAGELYRTNDAEGIGEEERETTIASLFKEQGVEVRFVGESKEAA